MKWDRGFIRRWSGLAMAFAGMAFAAIVQAEEKKDDAVLLPTEVREWTSADGRKTKSKLLAVDHEKKTVTLESDAGKKSEGLPFAKFSAADQAFFSRCKTQVAGQGDDGRIVQVDDEDPEMKRAIDEAVKTFPAAWKEIEKDLRRPIPALDMVMVKAAFRDPGEAGKNAELMWVQDFSFDGKTITGELANQPNRLKSVKMGRRSASLWPICGTGSISPGRR
ncbi:DUF2314 domain-containing protein [Luteolibacter arcticus]|uniref:DUF2314 domain-containing protein n=1 Tax=Luteolibacter arcticus TaxID=1581411 RepID=A0ABT3GNA5_9BACT|nr:DUF2314 domain-containing protein [Luteolibacter arcticus]MCW1924996.1 DUF2314 domain-containing protein [Luteolibacter arcticus]